MSLEKIGYSFNGIPFYADSTLPPNTGPYTVTMWPHGWELDSPSTAVICSENQPETIAQANERRAKALKETA